MRKILIYLIVVIFIITIFPSCSDENLNKTFSENEISKNSIDNNGIHDTETENKLLMRFDSSDYGGYIFKVMCMDSGNNSTDRFIQEIYVEIVCIL